MIFLYSEVICMFLVSRSKICFLDECLDLFYRCDKSTNFSNTLDILDHPPYK